MGNPTGQAKEPWDQLQTYRKGLRVSLRQLAEETMRHPDRSEHLSYVAIWRREQPPSHPDHVAMSRSELLALCALIERIVERRQREMSVAEVLAL